MEGDNHAKYISILKQNFKLDLDLHSHKNGKDTFLFPIPYIVLHGVLSSSYCIKKGIKKPYAASDIIIMYTFCVIYYYYHDYYM